MKIKNIVQYAGPGIVVAATGIGAGDLVAAASGGARYGYGLLWAVLVGALLKYVLNEGLARWQLASGMHLTQAWVKKMPSFFSWYFLIYLLLWSFMVGGALIAATGLAAHSLWPIFSVTTWGILHSLLALAFIFWGNYQRFETSMKLIISLMFVLVLVSVVLIVPETKPIEASSFTSSFERGSLWHVLAILGGVGGSVTLLSYGYWIEEKKWTSVKLIKRIRIDLAIAYSLTALFGMAIVILAADLNPETASGTGIVLNLSARIEGVLGQTGKWMFLVGFWAAVFTSMLGVWQGVPYLFADFWQSIKNQNIKSSELTKSNSYQVYLVGMATLPIVLLLLGKPVWLIVAYAAVGSLFMPFLAITLLWLNNQAILKKHRNGWLTNLLLVVSLCLFIMLALYEWIAK